MMHDHRFVQTGLRADARVALIARIGLALAAVALVHGLVRYLSVGLAQIWFPYELDYGEGIVWQQMREIVAGRGYAPIDGFPAIVFHYPPVYHLLAAGVAGVTGLDQLAAGRALSFGATLMSAGLAGTIVARLTDASEGPAASRTSGALTALILLTMSPVVMWSTYMRVDMVALAFSFGGFACGVRALERPRWVHVAALCFVAAVYTKQTAIAAPVAVFATLLFLRPRIAIAGIATSVACGLAALATLMWMTDGGFLRHILLYNLNRFEPERLLGLVVIVVVHVLYVGVAIAGGVHERRRARAARMPSDPVTLRERLLGAPADAGLLMVGTYLLVSTLMLVTVAKSGASLNYYIEWCAVLAIATGLAARSVVSVAVGAGRGSASTLLICLVPPAIAAQALRLPDVQKRDDITAISRRPELDRLADLVRRSPRPVISDDMVVLLRGGQPVVYEPAIFAELATKGLWDEADFVQRVDARAFGFFVTKYDEDHWVYRSRYNPAVAAAIKAAYPRKRRLAGYYLHLPPLRASATRVTRR